MAGYSGTPLAQKLGIKTGQKVVTIGAPAGYREASRAAAAKGGFVHDRKWRPPRP